MKKNHQKVADTTAVDCCSIDDSLPRKPLRKRIVPCSEKERCLNDMPPRMPLRLLPRLRRTDDRCVYPSSDLALKLRQFWNHNTDTDIDDDDDDNSSILLDYYDDIGLNDEIYEHQQAIAYKYNTNNKSSLNEKFHISLTTVSFDDIQSFPIFEDQDDTTEDLVGDCCPGLDDDLDSVLSFVMKDLPKFMTTKNHGGVGASSSSSSMEQQQQRFTGFERKSTRSTISATLSSSSISSNESCMTSTDDQESKKVITYTVVSPGATTPAISNGERKSMLTTLVSLERALLDRQKLNRQQQRKKTPTAISLNTMGRGKTRSNKMSNATKNEDAEDFSSSSNVSASCLSRTSSSTSTSSSITHIKTMNVEQLSSSPKKLRATGRGRINVFRNMARTSMMKRAFWKSTRHLKVECA